MTLFKIPKLAVLVSVAQGILLFTHALSGITVIFIPDKEPKYRTVRLNTGHLATLLVSSSTLFWDKSHTGCQSTPHLANGYWSKSSLFLVEGYHIAPKQNRFNFRRYSPRRSRFMNSVRASIRGCAVPFDPTTGHQVQQMTRCSDFRLPPASSDYPPAHRCLYASYMRYSRMKFASSRSFRASFIVVRVV